MSKLNQIKKALAAQADQESAALAEWLLGITTNGFVFNTLVKTEFHHQGGGRCQRTYHATLELRALARGAPHIEAPYGRPIQKPPIEGPL